MRTTIWINSQERRTHGPGGTWKSLHPATIWSSSPTTRILRAEPEKPFSSSPRVTDAIPLCKWTGS